METRDEVAARYLAVRHAIPPIEWPMYAGDVAAVLALKRSRRDVDPRLAVRTARTADELLAASAVV